MDSDSETSDTSSVPPSPSEAASPSASSHAPPTLERLVQHFASAKRSLTSTNHVVRANELVTGSRALLEEIAVLNARNTFTRRGVDEEVETLYAIRDGVERAGDEAGDEFTTTIARLDHANGRLEKTLEGLRGTVLDASLRRKEDELVAAGDDVSEAETPSAASKVQDEGSPRTLYDFIDPSTHSTLQSDLRTLIDDYNDARADLDTTLHHFSSSLKTISDTLSSKSSKELEDNPANKHTLYDSPPPSIPHLFHSIEDHAAEMATLLQSLVSHYDLCVTALKHTEGGGAAAKHAIEGLALAKNGTKGVEESLYLKTVPEPISEDERNEMLRVLENDAHEVDDVADELKDRNREQESHFQHLSAHAQSSRSTHAALRQALSYLHEMSSLHLPAHMDSLSAFRRTWTGIRTAMVSKTQALLGLAQSNEGFLQAYKELLREVARRKAAEKQILKVKEKARREIERLEAEEMERREGFVGEWGGYLPADLWKGAEEG